MEKMDLEKMIERLVRVHEDPSQEFDLIHPLGVGSYGWVYKAIHRKTNTVVAVKRVSLKEYDTIENCIKELEILESCHFQYIVGFKSAYIREGELWIAMEYCAGGSAKTLMKLMGRAFDEQTIAALMHSALQGLLYLHRNKMIHRDIKADNLLLDDEGRAKIADFGVSAKTLNTFGCKNTFIGTPYWMSPEILHKNNYTSKTDLWSLGITAIELAEMEPPHVGIYPWLAMEKIKKNPPRGLSQPSQWSKEFNEFVSLCLTVDPDRRPSAEQLLETPFAKKGALVEKKCLKALFKTCFPLIENHRLSLLKNVQKSSREDSNGQSEQAQNSNQKQSQAAKDSDSKSRKNQCNVDSPEQEADEHEQPTGTIVYHSINEIKNKVESDDFQNMVFQLDPFYAQVQNEKVKKLRDEIKSLEKAYEINEKVTLQEIKDQISLLSGEMEEKLKEIQNIYGEPIQVLEKYLKLRNKMEASMRGSKEERQMKAERLADRTTHEEPEPKKRLTFSNSNSKKSDTKENEDNDGSQLIAQKTPSSNPIFKTEIFENKKKKEKSPKGAVLKSVNSRLNQNFDKSILKSAIPYLSNRQKNQGKLIQCKE